MSIKNSLPLTTRIKVEKNDGIPVVSSLEIADKFEKNHKYVLEQIRKTILEVNLEFSEPNFRPANYIDAQGKKRVCFNLTKNAFILVAMGFTGREAMAWKVKFIEAFDCLEQQYIENLKKASRPTLPTSKQGTDTLTTTLRALELTQKGCTVAEAGRVINTPESTIRGRIRRIKKAMLPVFIKQLQAN